MLEYGKNPFKNYWNILKLFFKEHYENKSQIFKLSVADLKKTYNGSALGWAWAVIKPVFTVFVYWFAIAIGLRGGKSTNDCPFILWLMCGIIAWFYMTEVIVGGSNCIRRYSYLITKMRYPIMTIPTFTSLACLYVHLVLIAVTAIIFLISGQGLTIYMLQLPIYTILMFMFFNAWSLFAGLVSAMAKDFSNLVKSVNIGIFWLSAVLWNVENVLDKPVLGTFMKLNPVTFIVYGYRDCFIGGTWFWEYKYRLPAFIIEFLIMTFLSFWAYKKLRKDIPDVL